MNKKIKYINNDYNLGIVIDWTMVMKELKKLIEPYVADNYVPEPPWNSANWFVDCSERSVGKTTQYLLIGMILNKYYGITVEYLRLHKDQIRPIHLRDLFSTIDNPDYEYVKKITDGKYNSILYDSKRFYYCNRDEKGNINKVDIAAECFCHVEATDNVDNIKSLYNNSKASYVILDEFINASGVNREMDFLNLCQVLSTYRRNRLDMKIVLLANTINPYNQLFKELCVSDDIRKLKLGEDKVVNTPLGTNVWIHLVAFDKKVTEKRLFNNLQYFGFKNPKLSSINGGQEWAIKNYPHLHPVDIYNNEERKLIYRDCYLRHYDKLLSLELWYSTTIGTYLYVHEMTTTPKLPMRIYTLDTPKNRIEKYGIGNGDKLDNMIFDKWKEKRIFFSSNNIGNLFENYLMQIAKR